MPARKRASFALACLAALILLCSVPLLLRAPPKEVAQPLRSTAEADAVNWELLERVLSTQPPKDPRFRSQLGQDEWVARMHPAPGFYFDLGANSAIDLSNTHALDALSWRGICVDPFPVDFGNPAANRTCKVVSAAVAAEGGRSVEFVRPANGQIGGILGSLGAHKDEALSSNGTKVVTLRTLSIAELLAGSARHGDPPSVEIPRHIDYLSLDVEGQEADILEAWPWERVSIGLITVEHNYEDAKRRRIQKVLMDHGMVFAYHVDVDDWFQNGTLYPVSNVTQQLYGDAAALAAGSSLMQNAAVVPRRRHRSVGKLLVVAIFAALLVSCTCRRRIHSCSIFSCDN